MRKPAFENVEEFLQEKELYLLGDLPTEQSHFKTQDLSHWAKKDLGYGIQIIKDIDRDAIKSLKAFTSEFAALSEAIHQTLRAGRRIFLCGCGATGRLSLALESIWRTENPTSNQVQGFMAGGDIALVRSVENFEDMPAFGARHLLDLGFQPGDLLISSTEGGETPYVIGATEKAASLAKDSGGRKPYFLFCNPDDVLRKKVERSRQVFENPMIEKIAIPIGPMALSGSTRLQASTVLMLGIGVALMTKKGPVSADEFRDATLRFHDFVENTDMNFLSMFIQEEARIIENGDYVLYETEEFGITILTDTTERSPTFSLRPFENVKDPSAKPSWSYLCIPSASNSEEAWTRILGRLPIGLDWSEFHGRLDREHALGFDFSERARMHRAQRVAPRKLHTFSVHQEETAGQCTVHFELNHAQHQLSLNYEGRPVSWLYRHLLLKLLLNSHSLFMMGRLGRYENNVMTWVRPSNGKLIDRSIRYIQLLLSKQDLRASYEEVAREIFEVYPKLSDDEPVVLRVVESLVKKKELKQKSKIGMELGNY